MSFSLFAYCRLSKNELQSRATAPRNTFYRGPINRRQFQSTPPENAQIWGVLHIFYLFFSFLLLGWCVVYFWCFFFNFTFVRCYGDCDCHTLCDFLMSYFFLNKLRLKTRKCKTICFVSHCNTDKWTNRTDGRQKYNANYSSVATKYLDRNDEAGDGKRRRGTTVEKVINACYDLFNFSVFDVVIEFFWVIPTANCFHPLAV